MKIVSCHTITEFNCEFYISLEKDDELLISLLTHINEIHDQNFVPRCQDDLYVEYSVYVDQFKSIFCN